MIKLSGAAAAALPTIDLIEHGLKGCEVLEIEGILNATTNYLLDAMMNEDVSFDEALAQAGGLRKPTRGTIQKDGTLPASSSSSPIAALVLNS